MANARTLVAAVLLSTAVATGCTDSAGFPPAPPDETTTPPRVLAARARAVDALVRDSLDRREAPGAVVVLADHTGRRTVVHGLADTERGTPMRADHSFKLAGVTVPMVAALVVQLSEDGLVRLDQTVADLSPGLLRSGDKITLRDLLGHESGLSEGTAAADDDAFVSRVRRAPLDYEPGERFEYRNVDFAVLGLLVEEVTGEPLADVLSRRVFDPLGMRTARLSPQRPPPPGLARGYQDGQDVSDVDLSWTGGAGAVTGGAEDVSVFVRALFEGALVPVGSVREMTQMRDLNFESWSGYGLGVARVHTDCGVAYGHSGGVPGYVTEAWYDEVSGRSVAVVVNGVGGAVSDALGDIVEAALCD